MDPVTQDVILTEWTPGRIRKLSAGGGQVYTFAGGGATGVFADGTGTAACFNNPSGLAYDSSSDTYLVADSANNHIRRITKAAVVTTAAGSGSGVTTDGTGTDAALNHPRFMAAAPGPVFYIAESWGCAIRKMTAAGVVTTIVPAGCISSGTAGFKTPLGIAFRPADGKLYVADYDDCTVKSVAMGGTATVAVVVGASGSCAFADGSLASARINRPHGLALGPRGQLLLADRSNDVIREIYLDSNTVSTLAGSAGNAGSTDGTGTAARFYYPMDAQVVQHGGYLLVTDFDTGSVRKVS